MAIAVETTTPPGAPTGAVPASGEAAPRPAFRKEGLGYVYEPPGLGVRLRVDYLKERSDEVTGEVTVESLLPGVPPHLHMARLNLTASNTRTSFAKHLTTLLKDEHVPWGRLVEQFCVGVLRRERQGEPLVRVGRLNGAVRLPDQIERLVAGGKPTIWYGPGSIGKGWLATAACVCVETGTPLAGLRVRQGRTLYLDWEDSAESLNERIQAVASGLDLPEAPEVAYRKCRKTLPRDLNTIMRYAQDVGAEFVVVDSVGLAAGAAGERGYEDVALAFFDALRYLEPITVLCIDHVSGEGTREGAKIVGKAFGSIYKMNEARCAWEIRADQEPGAEETHLGFFHTKFNHSVRYPAMGFRLGFGPCEAGDPAPWVRIEREDVRDSAELRRSLKLPDQIAGVLRSGASHVKEVANELEQEVDPVRVALNRGAGKRFFKLPDGRWGLLESDRAAPPRAPHLRPVPTATDDGEAEGRWPER